MSGKYALCAIICFATWIVARTLRQDTHHAGFERGYYLGTEAAGFLGVVAFLVAAVVTEAKS